MKNMLLAMLGLYLTCFSGVAVFEEIFLLFAHDDAARVWILALGLICIAPSYLLMTHYMGKEYPPNDTQD